jgi:sulfane dehydrogenase subunit SoxC
MSGNRSISHGTPPAVVAANGLLDRRAFLRGGAAMAAAMTGYAVVKPAAGEALKEDPWSLAPGATSPPVEQRSRFEQKVVRTLSNPNGEPRNTHARTPHHLLNGTITAQQPALHHTAWRHA